MKRVVVKYEQFPRFLDTVRRLKLKHEPFRKFWDRYEIDLHVDDTVLNFLILANIASVT